MSGLAAIVLLPLLLGTGLCLWAGHADTPGRRRLTAWVAAAVAGSALALATAFAPGVFAGTPVLEGMQWVPALGLDLRFRLDGLALLFVWLITGIGLLVILYAAFYLSREDPAGKFYAQLMLFMAAMLGIVLADNLLLLIVFWELTSIASFLLIGYWGTRAKSRAGARMALAMTGGGGLALLGGVVLLGAIAGTYEISTLVGDPALVAAVQADPRFPVVLGLVLVGCFTKSAQLPFHFWLPEAMAAPTPVSAYLHSATMVKAGIFLLARLHPLLAGELYQSIVAPVGLATMLFAAGVALFRHDIKSLLAYSTISHLGLIVFLLGLSTPLAAVAAMFHVLNHATFKAALFMIAGIVDHETGTRDMRRLGGLAASMPWVTALAIVAAASMAGLPFLNGFLSKEMFFAEAVDAAGAFPVGAVVPVAAALGGLLSAAYSLRFVHDIFFRPAPADAGATAVHEPPLLMKAPVALLATLCVAVGIAPALLAGPLVATAAQSVLGAAPPDSPLALWHGFNWPLAMSAFALAGGAALYALLQGGPRFRLDHRPTEWSGAALFARATDGLFSIAGRVTDRLENGSLQRSVALMVGAALVLMAWPFLLGHGAGIGPGTRTLLPATPLALAIWLALAGSCVALVVLHRDRFTAVVLAGVVGVAASLAFVSLSAPDLALTQLSVDIVSTVLLLMALSLLPQATPRESRRGRRARDALLAVAGGVGIAWLAWLVLTRDHDSIAWFFLANSVPGGGGTNAVNVILVDFRGYDTFGEITVLAIAAIGVLALLDGFRVRRPDTDAGGRRWSFAREPLLLRVAARLVLPLALTVSAYIFWRGHNLPGGGFIAGLVTAAAFVVQSMALGQARAEAAIGAAGGVRYTRWLAAGMGVAALTGIGSFAVGRPFLTSAHAHPTVALLGELPLASAALFDLGVYLTVVAATLLMLSVLGSASKAGMERP